MAMLAEPRRKQKLSVNPRGNSWSKDNNKFGQRLMEKFGWTKGKGLGAKEDGKVDHVKVCVKTDQRGVGCSVSHADNWIAHQDDFNSILENLNQSRTDSQLGSTPGNVISLEAKSKNSKGRMHYKKFAKGKDLSSRTEEDLNCIFGVRKTKSGDNTPQCNSEENSDSDSQRENENSCGLKTIRSSDSVQEYFAKKMAALKRSRTDQPGGICEGSGMKISNAPNGFEVEKGEKLQFKLGEDNNEMKNAIKKSKKKKKKRKEEEEDKESNKYIMESADTETKSYLTEEGMLENCKDCDIATEKANGRLKNLEVSGSDLEDSDVKLKRKKSKKRKNKNDYIGDQVAEEKCTSSVKLEEPLKKKKKSKKNKKEEKSGLEEGCGFQEDNRFQKMENNSNEVRQEAKYNSVFGMSNNDNYLEKKNERTEYPEKLNTPISKILPRNEEERESTFMEENYKGTKQPSKPNFQIPVQQKTRRQIMVEQKTKAIVKEFKKKGANIEDITGYMCSGEDISEWLTEDALKRKEKNRKRKLRDRENKKHGTKKNKRV